MTVSWSLTSCQTYNARINITRQLELTDLPNRRISSFLHLDNTSQVTNICLKLQKFCQQPTAIRGRCQSQDNMKSKSQPTQTFQEICCLECVHTKLLCCYPLYQSVHTSIRRQHFQTREISYHWGASRTQHKQDSSLGHWHISKHSIGRLCKYLDLKIHSSTFNPNSNTLRAIFLSYTHSIQTGRLILKQ